MSESIRNPGGDESKLPSVFRKRRPEGARSTAAPGGFEQVFGEELGSVQSEGRSGELPAVESLLISRNLGALYRSFLHME